MELQNYSPCRDFPTLSTKVCDIEKSFDSLREQVKRQDKQIAQCLKNERDTAAALLKLQKDYNELSKYTSSLEEYCLDLDANIRKKHLILTGIEETSAETTSGKDRAADEQGAEMETEDSGYNPTLSVAFDILHAIYDTLLIEDLDLAYRLGKKGPNPRPILVKFAKESIRNEVNRKRFHLKDSDESKGVFLNEDLPAKVNAYRADLRCLVAHAKSKNVSAKLLGNRVSIDNKIYGHKDIDRLPDGLRMSDAKIVETVKGLAFQSHHAFLSNFFPCKVNYNAKLFKSAEHAYQYNRAVFLGFHTTAESVLNANKAEAAKRAASNLPNSKEWDAVKQKTMKDIVSAKFSQNLELQNKLLNTGEYPLLEATYDSYWGCGLPLTARKLKQGEWHRKNYLGIILAECRAELRRGFVLRNQHQIAHTNMSFSPPAQLPNTNMSTKHQPQRKSTGQKQSHNNSNQKPPHGPPNTVYSGYSGQSLSQNQVSALQPNQYYSFPQSQIADSQATQPNQPQSWPPQMMIPPQGFPYPLPNYFGYPAMTPMPFQLPQPQATPMPPVMSSPPVNNRQNLSRHVSPSVSDFSNHGDRRLSYDPELSPIIHV